MVLGRRGFDYEWLIVRNRVGSFQFYDGIHPCSNLYRLQLATGECERHLSYPSTVVDCAGKHQYGAADGQH